ncbi:hypothetical protein XI01_02620 [Bradyrhizobium sp. CCBAU 21360]|nr:hypothetical protein [Bradyrhizobium sp. CCBAU 21360]
MYEAKLYRSVNATRRALLRAVLRVSGRGFVLLRPVLWVSGRGFVLIMRAAKPLTEMMSVEQYLAVDEAWDYVPGEDSSPF